MNSLTMYGRPSAVPTWSTWAVQNDATRGSTSASRRNLASASGFAGGVQDLHGDPFAAPGLGEVDDALSTGAEPAEDAVAAQLRRIAGARGRDGAGHGGQRGVKENWTGLSGSFRASARTLSPLPLKSVTTARTRSSPAGSLTIRCSSSYQPRTPPPS